VGSLEVLAPSTHYRVDLLNQFRRTNRRPAACKYNLIELDLPRSDFDLLSEMMGLKRPADAIDTERGVVALTPVCDERGHAERFELSEEMSLEFIRR